MKFLPGTLALFISIFLISSVNVYADSLWQQDSSAQKTSQGIQSGAGHSLYGDQRAFKEGDTVVILILESAQASQNASTTTQKDGSVSGGLGTNLSGPFLATGGGSFAGIGASERQKGAGTNSRNGNLKATVSATITKILPNGNMEIKGSRIVTVNEEKENIEVSGVIRPADVASDNTVLSTVIADARISYEGKGPLGEKAKPGILTRILDWLWIF